MSEEILHFLDRIIELEATLAELGVVVAAMLYVFMITAMVVFAVWLNSKSEVKSLKRDVERLESRFNAKNGY